MAKKPVLLCIMDGFGWVPEETFGNAVVAAKKPHLDALMAKLSHDHHQRFRYGRRSARGPDGQL